MPSFKWGPVPDLAGNAAAQFTTDPAGQITAVFARTGVIDLDGDVTAADAFTEGAPTIISAYGHKSWEGALPVGSGTIHTVGDTAVLRGQFLMNTQAGRDTFETVKALGPLQEFSYGYDAETSFGKFQGKAVRFLNKVTVHEVSPTLKGSGIRTQLLDAKDHADLQAIRDALFGDDASAEAAAREYARYVRSLVGASR
jgi:hypothetical protein